MRKLSRSVVGVLLLVGVPTVSAAGLGKAFFRGTARSIMSRSSKTAAASFVGSARKSAAIKTARSEIFARDIHGPVTKLSADRTVFRYTTRAKARSEITRGIPQRRHFTSAATAGRPLSPINAQKQYGLPQRPAVRETIRVPQGTAVQFGRVKNGKPGLGEIFTRDRVSKSHIVGRVRLK